MDWIKNLEQFATCKEAIDYCSSFSSPQKCWDACERGDWMLWLLGRLAGGLESWSRRKLVLTACKCARLSLQFVPTGEQRPLRAIQMAEAWAIRNGATLDDVNADADADAAADAAAVAVAANAAAVAYAANAAANAAYAATYAANATYAAAAAYYTADAAAAYYVADAPKTKILKKCASIVRKYYPIAPRLG